MEYNKAVSNPMLVGAIELAKAERTPEHQELVTQEIFKAVYLSPAKVTPTPEADGVEIGPDMETTFPVLHAPGGIRFYMAFTDRQELGTWKEAGEWQSVTMTFEEYVKLLLKDSESNKENPAAGMVINPFSTNIIVYRDKIFEYVAKKMEQAYHNQKKTPREQK